MGAILISSVRPLIKIGFWEHYRILGSGEVITSHRDDGSWLFAKSESKLPHTHAHVMYAPAHTHTRTREYSDTRTSVRTHTYTKTRTCIRAHRQSMFLGMSRLTICQNAKYLARSPVAASALVPFIRLPFSWFMRCLHITRVAILTGNHIIC